MATTCYVAEINYFYENISMENKRLAIIVPYRDRAAHLAVFLPHMINYLKDIDYKIFVIEQDNNHFFNKATLLNIGFDLTKDNFDYFCFHDIDFVPIDGDYSYHKGVVHLVGQPEQHNWKMPSEQWMGGVFMYDKETFLKQNGFSNNYWGWGKEDDEVWYRCQLMGVKVERRPGRYSSLEHERYIDKHLFTDNKEYWEKLKERMVNGTFIDGYSQLNYTKNSETQLNDKAVHVKVDFPYTKEGGITKTEFLLGKWKYRLGSIKRKILGSKK